MSQSPSRYWPAWDSAVSANSSVNGTPLDVSNVDNVGVQIVWTSTSSLTGQFDVQASNDKVNWDTLPVDNEITTGGASGHGLYNLNEIPFNWIRVIYTSTSGTGSFTTNISGKAI